VLSGYVLSCCRILIGLVFGISLLSKVRSRTSYTAFVAAVPGLVPRLPGRLVAPMLVVAEAAIVILVALPPTAEAGFAVAAALLLAFSTAIWFAVRRRAAVTCQCFGSSSTPVGPAQLVRNVVLLLAAGAGLLAAFDPARSTPGPGVLVTALFTGATVALVVVLTDQIAGFFRSSL